MDTRRNLTIILIAIIALLVGLLIGFVLGYYSLMRFAFELVIDKNFTLVVNGDSIPIQQLEHLLRGL